MIALPPGSMANGGGENGERRLPKVDFSSGASFESLNHVIDLFDNQDRHEFDDQMALEVHSMKEHLFTLLGKIQECFYLSLVTIYSYLSFTILIFFLIYNLNTIF